MILAKKVRLKPTQDQEKQLWKSAGTARWAYNWALDKQIQHFEKTGSLKKISDGILRKELTILKQTEEYSWLYEVSNNVAKQAIKDLCEAIERFHNESKKKGYRYKKSEMKKGKPLTFRDFEDFPRFKSRKRSRPSFYHDTDKLKVKENLVLIEKVGWIKTSEQVPTGKYANPRVSFDGKYWCLSVGIEQETVKIELTDEVLGIDVGVKELAVCSNGKRHKNINKTKVVRKIEKRLRRLQRKVSRKYDMNKEGNRYVKTGNIIKIEQQIRILQRRLNGIRNHHIHEVTNAMVKTKPCMVVMETLNVKGMMKNKHLSKAIQQQKLYDFKAKLKYKCEKNGIKFVEADRWYPSSKMCSCCGNIKKDLKLSDRMYKCGCGMEIDRDLNASINLANYGKKLVA